MSRHMLSQDQFSHTEADAGAHARAYGDPDYDSGYEPEPEGSNPPAADWARAAVRSAAAEAERLRGGTGWHESYKR
jgi:hypothetical protein